MNELMDSDKKFNYLFGLINLIAIFCLVWLLWYVFMNPNAAGVKLYTPMYGFSLVVAFITVIVLIHQVADDYPFSKSGSVLWRHLVQFGLAGNYGPDDDSSVSPANDPAVLSVGAVNSGSTVETLSSRGANACTGGVFPSLVAPGDSVLTTDRMPGFYNIVSGTSFAVPHLAGGMAVLKSAFPDATVSEIEASLMNTAADLGAGGPDDDYGHGLMDVAAAYDVLAASQGGSNPGSLQLSDTGYSVDENVASLTVTVTRSGGSAGDVSVDFSTADDTALAGDDYTAASGTLDFAEGEMSRSFNVTILDDSVYEGDEDFTVTLSNVQGGASLGTPATAAVTLLEDDQEPDADGDGVSDVLDQCPGTPAGETVDANGCSTSQLDSDADGVSDDLDQCPNTPAGESADANGCSTSQLDSDNDGVSDALDQCPNTPAGETVDANGCTVVTGPVDGDGDGFTADLDCRDDNASIHPGAEEVKHDGIDQDCNGYDLTIDITRARYLSSTDKLVVLVTSDLGGSAALKMTVELASGGTVTKNMYWNASKNRWQKTLKTFVAKYGAIPVSVTVSGIEGAETLVVDQR